MQVENDPQLPGGPPLIAKFQYEEFQRLVNAADAHAQSAFGDFLLLGATGAILAWPPVANQFTTGDPDILLFGFVAALTLVLVVALMGSLKESLLYFYLVEAAAYGRELRKALPEETKLADLPCRWVRWFTDNGHRRRLFTFFSTAAILVAGFPTAYLVATGWPWRALMYAALAVGALYLFMRWKYIFYQDMMNAIGP